MESQNIWMRRYGGLVLAVILALPTISGGQDLDLAWEGIPPTAVGGLFRFLSTKQRRQRAQSHPRQWVVCSDPFY